MTAFWSLTVSSRFRLTLELELHNGSKKKRSTGSINPGLPFFPFQFSQNVYAFSSQSFVDCFFLFRRFLVWRLPLRPWRKWVLSPNWFVRKWTGYWKWVLFIFCVWEFWSPPFCFVKEYCFGVLFDIWEGFWFQDDLYRDEGWRFIEESSYRAGVLC